MLIYNTEYEELSCFSLAMHMPSCSPDLKAENHKAIHIHIISWNESDFA